MASAALSIAVENLKPNYRIAKTLAMALMKALRVEGYIPAFAKAGERMLVYDDIKKEYNAALEAILDMEEKLPWLPGEQSSQKWTNRPSSGCTQRK